VLEILEISIVIIIIGGSVAFSVMRTAKWMKADKCDDCCGVPSGSSLRFIPLIQIGKDKNDH